MAHKYPSFKEALRRKEADEISIDSNSPGGYRASSAAVFETNSSHGPLKQLPLPDLRFESAFVASVAPYIVRSESSTTTPSTSLVPGQADQLDLLVDPITIRWSSVAFVLFKDQLVLPLLNGIGWTLASMLLIQGWRKISR